ncbi:MAG: Hpt domain-containing protein [Proteobacteria bacterium]|nr:Hpt domain-containing protein [Pseudomonadota bacterium]
MRPLRPWRTMDDLLDDFLLETADTLPTAEAELVAWEADPSRRASLDAVFRCLHTVKSASGFLHLHRIEALADAAESRLARLRETPEACTPEMVGLLLQALDRIRDTVGHLELLGVEPADDHRALIAALSQVEAAPPPREERRLPHSPMRAASAEAPPPEPAKPERSVRVNLDVLDGLADSIEDLVRTRDQMLELLPTLRDGALRAPLQRLSVITGELQDGVVRARLQPVGAAWRALPRTVRDLSQALGKKVELVLDGGSDAVDREVVDSLKDSMAHLVRNSLDHGLEWPDERRAAGKSERGLIHISAWLEDGALAVRIVDDGRGLDANAIRETAAARGWLTPAEAAAMTDAQAHRLIFVPGFSTRAQATAVSGRGVGLDVVRSAAERMSGRVTVRSTLGEGTAITVRLPLVRPAALADTRKGEPELQVPPLRRVLLVEENAFFRHMMAPLLTAAGYDVTAAASADEAWRLHAEGSDFDVVVSDLDGTGPGFARRLKEESRWSAALSVALTDLPVGRVPVTDHFARVVRKSDRAGLIDALASSFHAPVQAPAPGQAA